MIVIEDDRTACDGDQHIEQAIPVHIAEAERNRGQVLPWPQQGGTVVDFSFGGITPRQLDHYHVAIQVDRDEVAGMRWGIVMPNHRIYLERARASVMPVILGGLPL